MNDYHNIWPSRSHTLAPLTRLTSIKCFFKWTQVEQYAFDKIKRTVARNNLLTYMGFNENFKINIHGRVFQLVEVVRQKDKLIDF